MSFDRRTFLTRTALGAAGLAAGSRLQAADKPAAAALPTFDAAQPETFWRAVRAQYPLAQDFIYFNTGGLGPSVQPALTAAAETTRTLQLRSEHGHNLLAGARAAVARFLGADPEEIAFVRNATEGNAIVAAGVKLAAGDEVIFETHAHPGGSFPWVNQEKLRGVKTKLFEPDPADAAGNLARIVALMTPRTRVVQVSHVTAPTGIVLPTREIARVCRERGAWFHIDGAQSAGMFPFSLHELDCDSFATSGHKWIGGPLETGVLYVRRNRLDDVAATLVGAYSGELDFLPGDLRLAPTAIRYEYGTRNAAAIVGLAEAMSFQERVGRERIAARGRALAAQVRAGFERIPGLEILTPRNPELNGSILTFRTRAIPYDKLFGRLMKDYSIRCRPVSEQKLDALRVSTHLFNSPTECAALVEAVEKIVRTA
ncbi:aminotransferase class V-fold PLP-dependent enzyme [Horticoccus sp. 23ND18S-11]|uniref:aminotransferase class V-fold PLP-dependent enzyme n=1 Tax=Horticoccus sp. 23ND18S-11 TaxID=3391832 RepID=UPI0039C9415E